MRRTIALIVVLLLFATTAFADTVRGKIVYADGVTGYPNVAVTLESSAGRSGTAYTGSDGMFYLEKIPAGEYRLEVKSAKETKTLKISVQPQPYTDIAPVRMN